VRFADWPGKRLVRVYRQTTQIERLHLPTTRPRFALHGAQRGYWAYRDYENRLRCLTHLLRKARGLEESLDREAQRFGQALRMTIEAIMEAVYAAREGPPSMALREQFAEQLLVLLDLCMTCIGRFMRSTMANPLVPWGNLPMGRQPFPQPQMVAVDWLETPSESGLLFRAVADGKTQAMVRDDEVPRHGLGWLNPSGLSLTSSAARFPANAARSTL